MGLLCYKERYTKQSCSFWPRYAPNRLSAGALPQTPTGAAYSAPDPLAGLGGGARGKGNEEGKGEGKRKGGQRPRSQEAEVRFGGGMIVDLLGSRVKLENLKF